MPTKAIRVGTKSGAALAHQLDRRRRWRRCRARSNRRRRGPPRRCPASAWAWAATLRPSAWAVSTIARISASVKDWPRPRSPWREDAAGGVELDHVGAGAGELAHPRRALLGRRCRYCGRRARPSLRGGSRRRRHGRRWSTAPGRRRACAAPGPAPRRSPRLSAKPAVPGRAEVADGGEAGARRGQRVVGADQGQIQSSGLTASLPERRRPASLVRWTWASIRPGRTVRLGKVDQPRARRRRRQARRRRAVMRPSTMVMVEGPGAGRDGVGDQMAGMDDHGLGRGREPATSKQSKASRRAASVESPAIGGALPCDSARPPDKQKARSAWAPRASRSPRAGRCPLPPTRRSRRSRRSLRRCRRRPAGRRYNSGPTAVPGGAGGRRYCQGSPIQ